jgi:hypothetical protein
LARGFVRLQRVESERKAEHKRERRLVEPLREINALPGSIGDRILKAMDRRVVRRLWGSRGAIECLYRSWVGSPVFEGGAEW